MFAEIGRMLVEVGSESTRCEPMSPDVGWISTEFGRTRPGIDNGRAAVSEANANTGARRLRETKGTRGEGSAEFGHMSKQGGHRPDLGRVGLNIGRSWPEPTTLGPKVVYSAGITRS